MEIRAFQPRDQEPCLALAAARSPEWGARFTEYLLMAPRNFHVLEHEGQLLACGGFDLADGVAEADLRWLLVSPPVERQGLGRYLLMYLLKQISAQGNVSLVHVYAPEPYGAFYLKQGFRPQAEHRYTKKLSVCA